MIDVVDVCRVVHSSSAFLYELDAAEELTDDSAGTGSLVVRCCSALIGPAVISAEAVCVSTAVGSTDFTISLFELVGVFMLSGAGDIAVSWLEPTCVTMLDGGLKSGNAVDGSMLLDHEAHVLLCETMTLEIEIGLGASGA